MLEHCATARYVLLNVSATGRAIDVSGDLELTDHWRAGVPITNLLDDYPAVIDALTPILGHAVQQGSQLLCIDDLEFRILPDNKGGAVVTITSMTPALRMQREIGGVVSSISHQLRTPLTTVLGVLEMLQSNKLTPDQTSRALAAGRRNAEGMSRIVQNLSRWESAIGRDKSTLIQSCELVNIGRSVLAQCNRANASDIEVSADDGTIKLATHSVSVETIFSCLFEELLNASDDQAPLMLQIRHVDAPRESVSVRVGRFKGAGWTKLEPQSAENNISWQELVLEGQATHGLAAAQLAVASAEGKFWLERTVKETAYCFSLPAAH